MAMVLLLKRVGKVFLTIVKMMADGLGMSLVITILVVQDVFVQNMYY